MSEINALALREELLTLTGPTDSADEDFIFLLTDSAGNELARLQYTILASDFDLTVDATSLDESNDTVIATFSANEDGTYYYWQQGTGINADDFSLNGYTNTSRGTVTISGGTGQATMITSPDKNREGVETFTVQMSRTALGTVIAESQVVTISDTSIPTYSIVPPDVTEGNNLIIPIFPNSNDTESVFMQITGPALAQISNGVSSPISVGSIPTGISFTTVDSDAYSGGLTGTATLRLVSDSSALATDTFTINDNTPVYTLTSDKTNDSANEGELITFTLGGTNIQDGTYYYYPTDHYPATIDQTVNSGTAIIYIDTTANIAVGMECTHPDVNGTVLTIITNDYVIMSSNTSATLNINEEVWFTDEGNVADFDEDSASGLPAVGFFAVTSNNGTFDVQTKVDSDRPVPNPEEYTFGVWSDHVGGSLLAAKLIEINDFTTGFTVGFDDTTVAINNSEINAPSTVRAEITFHTNGSIFASYGNSTPVDLGDWIDPTSGLTASDYTIYADIISGSGYDTTSSSTMTPTSGSPYNEYDIDANRVYGIRVTTISSLQYKTASATIDFTIYETANPSNTATIRVSYSVASGDPGEPF